jgi:hypothetical protein
MRELTKCRDCHKPIWLVDTEKGHRMPVDPDPAGRSTGLEREAFGAPAPNLVILRDGRVHVLRGDERWHGELYLSHFATCAYARRSNRKALRRAFDRTRARVFEGLHDDLQE